jgi:hypothetical protein
MSIELVAAEIRRFLSSEEPEVLSISGDWGVGKTFAWNRYLQAEDTKNIEDKGSEWGQQVGAESLNRLLTTYRFRTKCRPLRTSYCVTLSSPGPEVSKAPGWDDRLGGRSGLSGRSSAADEAPHPRSG